jgi:dipeptidyl-peptidase-3
MISDEKAAMEHLIDYFQTGNRASYNRYLELWSGTHSEVETFIGLVNPSSAISGDKGLFEAIVMIHDTELSALMQKAAGLATHYRQQMPWSKRYKRGTFEPAVPLVYNVAVATGNAGPFTRAIMDVPSDPKMAKKYGQKRFYLTNVADAADRVIAKKALFEFSANQEVADRRSRWHRVARNDLLVLREVIGRGMVRSGLERVFGTYAKPLEEMFCALAALYLVFDPKNQEIGLVPTEESAKAMYDGYASGMLEQLAEVSDSDALVKPQMRARQAIVRYVIKKGAAELIFEGGHLYVRVTDYQAMRSAIRELLSKVHKIMTSGDTAGGRKLIMELGTAFPIAWRIDVQRRFAKLGLPGVVGYSYPTLVPRLDDTGKIVEVVLK